MAGRPKKIQVPEIKKIDNQNEFPVEFEMMKSGTVRVYNKKRDSYSEMARSAAKDLLRADSIGNYQIIE